VCRFGRLVCVGLRGLRSGRPAEFLGFAVKADKGVFGGAVEICFVEETEKCLGVKLQVVVGLRKGEQARDGVADRGFVLQARDGD
jgi:hypothetical protein